MRQRPKSLIVSGILVHRNVDNALEDSVDLILCLLALFVLYVLVPERMGQEVEADVGSSAFKETTTCQLSDGPQWRGGLDGEDGNKSNTGRDRCANSKSSFR